MRRTIMLVIVLVLASFATAAANPSDPDTRWQGGNSGECRFFEATGYEVCGDFYAFWQQYGGVAIFGYAISDEFQEDGLRVQYFERARLEHQPGVWPERGDILLGRLGAELLERSGPPSAEPSATLLVDGLEGTMGSTIGPDGALFVTEGAKGDVTRVDPVTGETSTFASGLPQQNPNVGFGGAMDIVFIDSTAYVLVTLVGPDVGGDENDVVGIYRVDASDEFTVIADIGAYLDPATVDDPEIIIDVPSGVQFQMAVYDGDLIVTDGHYNRVLRVTLDGDISEMLRFGNEVPTGIAVVDAAIHIALAGPVPHLPEDGKIVVYDPVAGTVTDVAAGAPLLIDVKSGPGGRLYALSQGEFEEGLSPGSPAQPNTGALVRATDDGGFTTVVDGLNLPTSIQFIDSTAYVVSFTGEIWAIDVDG